MRAWGIAAFALALSMCGSSGDTGPPTTAAKSGAQLTGVGSLREARSLAAVLRGGRLPSVPLVSRGSNSKMEN